MKHWQWILPTAVATGIILVLVVFVIPSRENDLEYDNNRKIKDLTESNELLLESNWQLENKVKGLQTEADSLFSLITQDRMEINTLNIKKDEKMDAIAGYDDDELFRFFATFKTDSTDH